MIIRVPGPRQKPMSINRRSTILEVVAPPAVAVLGTITVGNQPMVGSRVSGTVRSRGSPFVCLPTVETGGMPRGRSLLTGSRSSLSYLPGQLATSVAGRSVGDGLAIVSGVMSRAVPLGTARYSGGGTPPPRLERHRKLVQWFLGCRRLGKLGG